MFACSVFFHCSLFILYFICIFLLLLPTWRIKLMMMIKGARIHLGAQLNSEQRPRIFSGA